MPKKFTHTTRSDYFWTFTARRRRQQEQDQEQEQEPEPEQEQEQQQQQQQQQPVGGKTAPAVVSALKKRRVPHSETTGSFPKLGLNFPGNLKCFF